MNARAPQSLPDRQAAERRRLLEENARLRREVRRLLNLHTRTIARLELWQYRATRGKR